jgi:hypothetical protein
VTCVICRAALDGVALPAEAIDLYNRSKGGMRPVSLVNVSEELTVGGEKFTLRSLGTSLAHALGFPKKDVEPLQSVKVAKSKNRGRLFEGVDLDKEPARARAIGSMEEIDGALNAARDKG